MRTNIFSIFKGILTMFLLSVSVSSLAQIKYTSQGKLTVGNVTPYSFYPTTHWGSIYLKDNQSNFLQFDITPTAPRIAGHGDQIVSSNEYGMLAQEVEIVFPELIQKEIDKLHRVNPYVGKCCAKSIF